MWCRQLLAGVVQISKDVKVSADYLFAKHLEKRVNTYLDWLARNPDYTHKFELDNFEGGLYLDQFFLIRDHGVVPEKAYRNRKLYSERQKEKFSAQVQTAVENWRAAGADVNGFAALRSQIEKLMGQLTGPMP